eukprot:3971690-Ditylum_brightwellii.AAC.1
MDGANKVLGVIVLFRILGVWLSPSHGLERIGGGSTGARGFPARHVAEGGPDFIGHWGVGKMGKIWVWGDEVQRCDVAGKRMLVVEYFVEVCVEISNLLLRR